MKRLLIIIAFFATASVVSVQSPQPIDTIYNRVPLVNGVVSPNVFMDVPMTEEIGLSEEELKDAADNGTLISLISSTGVKNYRVEKGITRYLWLATRMGQPTVKDAPGLEVIQTYNPIKE